MDILPGAALGRQARLFIQRQNMVVPIDQHGLSAGPLRIAGTLIHLGFSPCRSPQLSERRNPDVLARLKPLVGLDASTVKPDLPGPKKLRQASVGEARIMNLDPAIEPQAGLVVADCLMLNAAQNTHHAM